MSFYSDVNAGVVKATMILAVPRSASTMLSRALSASPDVDVNVFQPFYREDSSNNDLEQKLGDVMRFAEPTPKKPIKMTMKVMAESVTGQHFRHLMEHSENIVVLLRDPQSQALSAYRAYWRLPSGKPMNPDELKKLRAMKSLTSLEEYIVTPWERMACHVRQLLNHQEDEGKLRQWSVIDGDILRLMAEPALKRVCQRCKLSYVPEMIDGWSDSGEKTVGLVGHHYRPSWLARAIKTDGIKPPTAMTPRLEDFSPQVRDQIQKNLEVYVRILACNQELAPKPNELKSLIKQGFAKSNPIALYALTAILPEPVSRQKAEMLKSIVSQAPEYASSYAVIDRVAGRAHSPQARHSTRAEVSYGL